MISFSGVGKSFGDNHVLRKLDLTVAPGEKVSIIGPSGSGKTTILRLLMTLENPDTGLIEVDGEPLWDCREGARLDAKKQAEVRRTIGMVFQHFNLFPHMTTLGNVTEAPVHVLGMKRVEARALALDYLAMVGLAEKADAYPGELSGGQKQRVAIARALAMRPKVMLFDEITSALDPELVGGILDLLRKPAAQRTVTMVIVTHHMAFAESSSDRVLFFDEGVIVEDGAPGAIFHNPRSERTRRFVQAVLESH